jgi:hypothetical protein
MKNLLLLIVFSMLLFPACHGCKDDKGEAGNDNSDNPGQLTNNNQGDFKNQEYTLPSELEYGRVDPKNFLYDKFYPIGWSKDGKLAYIIEPADEASGYYWFEIIIRDIVNNKTTWSWKPAESEKGNLQSTWKDNYDLFKKHLGDAQIIQLEKFELKPTKISYKGNDYELILDASNVTDPNYGLDVVKETNLSIVSKELGTKSIAKQKEDESSRVIGAIIPGFILCPFDDRIVVILRKERIGYEGPPNVVYFDLFGSDLTRAFKKQNDS